MFFGKFEEEQKEEIELQDIVYEVSVLKIIK